ncbi:MAG: LytR family transcriptional regulator [Ruminococcaceae bacterium]|nr:LytR family transcriptional regulator [Oscillospiraceae bacterium]
MDESNNMLDTQPEEKTKKKLGKGKIALIIVGSVLLVLILAVVGLGLYMFSGLNTDKDVANMDPSQLGATPGATTIVRGPTETDEALSSDRIIVDGDYQHVELPEEVKVHIGESKESVSTLLPGSENIQVFAVFGTDLEDLSDCNMIVALDRVHNKIKIISIARDSYVYYSDLGISSKINHAYNWGGPAMSIKVLNENYYLNVEDYVSVDWDQMQNIVNYLHGVWVYLDYDEWVAIGSPERYGYNRYVKLYGLHARKYAGLRSIDSDFQRMSRQQEVLTSMYNIGRNVKFSKYPGLIYYCLNMCTTSFGYTELLEMSTLMLEEDLQIEFHTFPPDDDTYAWGGFIDEVFYFVYDTDKASDEIYKIIYEELYVSGYDAEEEEPEETPEASTAPAQKPAQSTAPAASAKPAETTPEQETEEEESGESSVPSEEADLPDATEPPAEGEETQPSDGEQDVSNEEQEPAESEDPLDALLPEEPTESEDPLDALVPPEESEPTEEPAPSEEPEAPVEQETPEEPAPSEEPEPPAEPAPSEPAQGDGFDSILGF